MNHTTDTTTANDDAWADPRWRVDSNITPRTDSWRAHHDNLTPAQTRHLAALERIALAHLDSDGRDTAHQILDNLATEAAWYAEHNPAPGTNTGRRCLDTITAEELTTADVLALLDLVQAALVPAGGETGRGTAPTATISTEGE